ncbi:hypothetical protein FSP39_025025 [Pinctada imbricata]|uniref:Major facilitator superfamily (MFS) profile domain-containing protein n=1 Tax=Pinctada imbricata TaxID=66713 RepID=A0AA89BQW6_PINIB|nr:hypothetical protein FSP39_025025 [Pinctada imbricata]
MKQRSNGEVKQETSEAENYPKGGWKWMILFSAFIFNVILDGCSYSFGVLYTRLVKDFKSSRSDTAWIGSVFASAPLLCGPVASFVTNRYGFRKASIVGGIIAFVGLFTSVFAPSVEILCITYGVIGGIGFSLPYLVSSVIVPIYFHRKVALASGIAECGSGVGTLIFAPLLEYLIKAYDWRCAILITAGVVANTVVCGAVNRPFNPSFEKKDGGDYQTSRPKFADKIFPRGVSKIDMTPSSSYMTNVFEDSCHNVHVAAIPFSLISNISKSKHMNKTFENEHSTSCPQQELLWICLYCENMKRNKDEEACCFSKSSLIVFDTSILFNWRYIMFSLSNIILNLWDDIPYMFTVDRAVELGESEFDASLLISAIGAFHTIGTLAFGFIGDRKDVNKLLFYSVALWICGVSLAVVPLFNQLIDYGIFVGVYGLFSAVTEALKVAIVVDIVGMAK